MDLQEELDHWQKVVAYLGGILGSQSNKDAEIVLNALEGKFDSTMTSGAEQIKQMKKLLEDNMEADKLRKNKKPKKSNDEIDDQTQGWVDVIRRMR
jgi:hypothetical protein